MSADTPKLTKSLTRQQRIVLEYLQAGRTLTNMVAMTCLQVGSLSSRIAELRKLGYKIKVRHEVGHDGRGYNKYDIEKEEAPYA